MNRAIRILSIVFTIWGVALATAVAADTDSISDEAIRAAVEAKLERAKVTNGGGPYISVDENVVTLEGSVRSLWAKAKAIELAMDVDDVTAVEDRLEIADGESDEAVAKEVAKTIRYYPFFTVYDDVSIRVSDGNVKLEGRVTMPFKSEEIGKRVSKIMGVQSIDNGILTLPTSIGDRKIRANLAYRLYSDSLFREYAFRANPPIHIIVENGRVSLTGAVRSEVEKRKAGHIARSTFGVFNVENRLTVGD